MGIFDDKSTSTSSTTSSANQTGTSAQNVTGGTQQTLPSFLAQHQQDVIALGRQGATQSGVAGLSADEQQAIEQQRANQGNWTPGLSSAINLATSAASTPSATDISKFSNPYLQGNLDAQQRQLGRGLQTQLGGLAGGDISSGSFGGSRGARAAAQATAQGYSDLADKQNAAQAADWTQANQLYGQNADRQARGATQLGGLATQLQQQGQSDVSGLLKTGELQRGLEQRAIDLPTEIAQKQANIAATVSPHVARGSQNWSSTTGQTAGNTNQQSNTSTTGSQGKGGLSQLIGLAGLLGNNASGIGQLLGGGAGGSGILGQAGNWLKGLGGGGGGSYANPFTGGYTGNYDTDFSDGGWEGTDAWDQGWGDWKDGGSVMPPTQRAAKMADGGQVGDLNSMLAQQAAQLNQIQQKQEKQLGFGEEPSLFAEGGMAQGEENVDPMQALDVLAQAGCPPELLQQVAQCVQGGGGGAPAGGPPGAGGPPPMACGGLAHMAGGGGAYGIDPAMIQRLMAASGGRNPMGGQSANPMAPGHYGQGQAGQSNMGNPDPRRRPGSGYGVDLASRPAGGLAHGGMAMPHMAGGGQMDLMQLVEMMKRAGPQANPGAQSPFGGASANPMAPGHMGAGAPGMSDMSMSPQQAQERRRMLQMQRPQTQM